jgi:acyl-[acyl-carrier-protein]-phospholipid O-acyltransferase/long-chain-fatty-acid--[acyl-carrier-protein] ligase
MSVQSPPVRADQVGLLTTPDRPMPPLPADWQSLPEGFLSGARTHWNRPAIIDSLGTKLTYGQALTRALVLTRLLKRTLGSEPNVGLLIPPGAAAAVANIAVAMLGKVAINLNYSASKAVIDSSVTQSGIRQIITTPKILDKIGYKPDGELIYLEDLAKTVTLVDKVVSAAMAKLAPRALLGVFLPGLAPMLDHPATVIFTSGSTGDSKGVVLTHANILSNVHQINNHLDLLPEEVVLGILPFFHSFGYTVAIWTVLLLGKRVVYHVNPLDYRIIPDLIEKHGVTMIASSPTFMKSYCERARPGQLKSLVHILLGSERLKPEVTTLIRATVGRDPLEGYGTTELSPVVSVNTLKDMTTVDGRTVYGNRLGTAGMPLPGTAIKTVDPETGVDLPRGTEGVIWVKGPQVMKGYLNRPEETAKVLRNGWYCTGDLGYLDPDGFLKITGRLSRFAKIGGEMVPLDGVESAIQDAAGVGPDAIAVTVVPDPKRGERLVVLYTDLERPVEEVYQSLNASSLPKLWIPSSRDFFKIEVLPTLSVGKRDLRRIKEIALERLG